MDFVINIGIFLHPFINLTVQFLKNIWIVIKPVYIVCAKAQLSKELAYITCIYFNKLFHSNTLNNNILLYCLAFQSSDSNYIFTASYLILIS